ncbi:MAG TPA: SNF2-related protein, partial [Microlunatus sp.]|nr:SNF2-related protein [Microlunatus sp.]
MWARLLSNDAIIAMVGHEAFARGMVYARNGNVADVRVDTEQLTVSGQVVGSDRRRYLVLVELVDLGGHTGHRATCTCPVVRDCKHAAAVLFTARAKLADEARSARPEWELVVNRLVREASAAAAPVEVGLELSVEVGRTYGAFQPAPKLLMRPVRRGSRGRWVYSGMSWTDLDYPSDGLSPDVQDLLLQFRAAAGSAARYASPRSAWLTLDEVSTAFWSLLEGARRFGVELVTESGEPRVLAERVAVRLDLRSAPGGGLIGHVALPHEAWAPDELWQPDELTGVTDPVFGLLGDPAHGAYWLSGPAAGGPRELVLARLERSLPAELRRVVHSRTSLEIPTGDRDRFLSDYLPALRRAVPVTSTDESVELPAATPPQLALTVGFRPEHRVRLDWTVRYRYQDQWRSFGIDDSPLVAGGLRDPAVEHELLAGLELPYADLPQLADPDRPRRPAAHALLGDAHAAQFVHDVLPRLSDQGVHVQTQGDVVDYRPAESDPEVTVSTAATEVSDWFDLHIQVRVDGELVPFEELFVALSTGAEFLVLETGVYVPLDNPALDRLRDLIEEARALQDRDRPQLRISRFQTALWDELSQIGVVLDQADRWQEAVRALAGSDLGGDSDSEAPAVPGGLHADLRPYQRDGYRWLTGLWRHRLGGVLADDMGLGKTVQTLAMIAYAREQDPGATPFLVVAPTSVVTTWASEAARFLPDLDVRTVTRSQAKRRRTLA